MVEGYVSGRSGVEVGQGPHRMGVGVDKEAGFNLSIPRVNS